jgi:outer membrane lipoprotein carrier protein
MMIELMIGMRRCAVVAMVMAIGTSTAHASGLDQLKAFVQATKSGRATFKQVVVGKASREAKESTGTFSFQRPGKFRWAYEKPFEQLIVGDGGKVWIYDRDLNQVIVRKLDVALGASPAALLAGDNALENNFDVTDAGKSGDLEMIDAKPKSTDTGFERVRIGFKDNLPRSMELKDTFGNVTSLAFGTFERNAALDAAQFKFVPPKGADVVGE